jgi:hypothetical protein
MTKQSNRPKKIKSIIDYIPVMNSIKKGDTVMIGKVGPYKVIKAIDGYVSIKSIKKNKKG